jgi:hypothetical protein
MDMEARGEYARPPSVSSLDKKDELLQEHKTSDTTLMVVVYPVKQLAPLFSEKLNNVAVAETTARKDAVSLKSKRYEARAPQKEVESDKEIKLDSAELQSPEKVSYHLEFWVSPLHYKGYTFIGKNIKLYGLINKGIVLHDYKGSLILEQSGIFYKLEHNATAKSYTTVTDKAIITELKKQ